MTGADLVKTLADDLGVTRSRVEDFLNALKDIVVERLLKRENVNVAGFGTFELTKGADRPFRFHFAKELYPRLGINTKIKVERCEKCGAEPPLPARRIGRKCLSAEQRARRRRAVQGSKVQKFKVERR